MNFISNNLTFLLFIILIVNNCETINKGIPPNEYKIYNSIIDTIASKNVNVLLYYKTYLDTTKMEIDSYSLSGLNLNLIKKNINQRSLDLKYIKRRNSQFTEILALVGRNDQYQYYSSISKNYPKAKIYILFSNIGYSPDSTRCRVGLEYFFINPPGMEGFKGYVELSRIDGDYRILDMLSDIAH